jgi:spore coat protein CotH
MKNIILLVFIIVSNSSYSQSFYDINNISTIELIFEEDNWNDILIQYKLANQEQRLLATAIVNGVQFDSVGVRYKGNSTFNPQYAKNPLNIKLDYIFNQDYNGFETLKLSSGSHDPSFVREVMSYEIARKYMIAPHSNYAKVFINGKYHGLYSNSESVNSDFGQKYLYADKGNIRIKCNSDGTGASRGAALEYWGSDSTKYFG